MAIIRSILVPVDFSEPSRAAIRMAIELARVFDASVTLLHFYPIPAYAFPDGVVVGPEIMARLGTEAQRSIERLAEEHAREGVTINGVAEPGSPASGIVDRAEAEHTDLIVMGTHGRTGWRHIVLGSVAERVVRLAPCPVLTVRGELTARGEAEPPASHP